MSGYEHIQSLQRNATSSFSPPLPSTADRDTQRTSRGHFCGDMVIGDGSGQGGVSGIAPRVIQLESYLEYQWCLYLSVHRDIADIREQMEFGWIHQDGKAKTHYFDFLLTMRDGRRIGCAVRPVARASASLILRLEQISAQAAASGFADEVRLLTDHDLDPIGLHNAELLHSARAASPIIDMVAEQVVTTMHGRMPLGQLSEQVGCGPQGYRALLRLLRKGVLGLSEHARITLSSTVHKEVMPQ